MFWTTSWIDYIFNDLKAACNAALGESADDDSVIGVKLEEDKISVLGWDYVLEVSIGALVKNNLLSVLSTDIGPDADVTVKSIVVPLLGYMTLTSLCCPFFLFYSSTYTEFFHILISYWYFSATSPPTSDYLRKALPDWD